MWRKIRCCNDGAVTAIFDGGRTMKNIISLLRVKHWIKNVLVFTPVCLVNGAKWNMHYGMRLLIVFVSFCLAASLIYVLNDIIDHKSDLAHPRKKNRPIASGAIKIPQAIGIMGALIGMLISLQTMNGNFNQVILLYVILNVLYSCWLKKIPIIDLIVIASCYLLRIGAGLEAMESNVPFWIIIAIFFVTLSIIAGKRRSEKMVVKEEGAHRKVLGFYNVEFLNYTILIASIGAINAYVLFVHDLCVKPKSDQLIVYSIPLILFGILKYLHTIFSENKGDDPVEIILKDYSLQVVSLACFAFLVKYSI